MTKRHSLDFRLIPPTARHGVLRKGFFELQELPHSTYQGRLLANGFVALYERRARTVFLVLFLFLHVDFVSGWTWDQICGCT